MHRALLASALVAGLLARPSLAQTEPPRRVPPRLDTTPVSLSGPRVGLTAIAGSLADTLDARYGAAPVLTQFGWQFETRMFQVDESLTGMTELVALLGGLEQGLFLPSVSWLVALRSQRGAEFGMGPNVSASGPALVLAGGVTLRSSSGLHFPVNLAVASGRGGQRVSLLVGFTLER